jgi:hypothetical protein
MLVLRADQMQAIEAGRLRRFEQEMVAHARAFAPQRCEELGEEGTRRAVHEAVAIASTHGFDLRGTIRLVVEIALLYGSDFPAQPRCAPLAILLRDARDQVHRAQAMYAWASDESHLPAAAS